jgi:hypothetical protein
MRRQRRAKRRELRLDRLDEARHEAQLDSTRTVLGLIRLL